MKFKSVFTQINRKQESSSNTEPVTIPSLQLPQSVQWTQIYSVNRPIYLTITSQSEPIAQSEPIVTPVLSVSAKRISLIRGSLSSLFTSRLCLSSLHSNQYDTSAESKRKIISLRTFQFQAVC